MDVSERKHSSPEGFQATPICSCCLRSTAISAIRALNDLTCKEILWTQVSTWGCTSTKEENFMFSCRRLRTANVFPSLCLNGLPFVCFMLSDEVRPLEYSRWQMGERLSKSQPMQKAPAVILYTCYLSYPSPRDSSADFWPVLCFPMSFPNNT